MIEDEDEEEGEGMHFLKQKRILQEQINQLAIKRRRCRNYFILALIFTIALNLIIFLGGCLGILTIPYITDSCTYDQINEQIVDLNFSVNYQHMLVIQFDYISKNRYLLDLAKTIYFQYQLQEGQSWSDQDQIKLYKQLQLYEKFNSNKSITDQQQQQQQQYDKVFILGQEQAYECAIKLKQEQSEKQFNKNTQIIVISINSDLKKLQQLILPNHLDERLKLFHITNSSNESKYNTRQQYQVLLSNNQQVTNQLISQIYSYMIK